MIKANELRIGNFITIDNGEKPPYIYEVTAHDMEEIDGCGEDCFPIPLTPEILEKCGLRLQAQRTSIYIRDRLKIWIGHINGGIAYLKNEDTDDSFYIGQVSYLHQLQNLYFALTGKELEYSAIMQ